MKKMNKLTVAALALMAIGLASTAASAQTVSAGTNDLILGFQIASGTGSNTDLEVDLGSYTQFTTSATLTLAQLNVADLTATYGSGWADLTSGVNWSVAGITTGNTSYYATSTTSIKTSSQGLLSASYGLISSLAPGLSGQPQTANSTSAATIGNNSTPASSTLLPNSYTNLEGGNGYDFVANAETTGASTDELYSFAPASKTGSPPAFPNAGDLGTFSLSDTGVLTFTGSSVAAVPEPSAYALGICAALLFLVLRRRQSVA